MKVLTESVVSIIHFVVDDAKKRFKNLRARYTRDKNKVTKKKKSGGGTDEVQDAKKETSELYPYLGWLDAHVTRRRRSKGSLVPGEKSSQAEGSDDYESSLDESELESGRSELESSVETSASEEKYSKATGNIKWEKRDKKSAKKDVDNVEVEMLKCMTQCLKKPPEKQKDEDELFGSFVASQLKGMSPEQNAMAKYQINQICFQIKMSNMGMPGLGYSSPQNMQGFPPRQNFAPPLSPQMASQPFLQENQYTLLS